MWVFFMIRMDINIPCKAMTCNKTQIGSISTSLSYLKDALNNEHRGVKKRCSKFR